MISKSVTRSYSRNTSIKTILQSATNKLKRKSVARPEQIARLVLEFLLEVNSSWLIAHDDYVLTDSQKDRLNIMVDKLCQGIPLEYITHDCAFCDTKLYINRSVLIPRYATEMLVEETRKIIHHLSRTVNPVKIIDVGTGSGAIAIAIAQCCKRRNIDYSIIATDVSTSALKVAQKNINSKSLNNLITIKINNLLHKIKNRAHIIVANLPYLPYNYDRKLADPKLALVGGELGHEKIEALLKNISTQNNLHPHGKIILEIGYDQADIIRQKAHLYFPSSHVKILKDLEGWDRILVISI